MGNINKDKKFILSDTALNVVKNFSKFVDSVTISQKFVSYYVPGTAGIYLAPHYCAKGVDKITITPISSFLDAVESVGLEYAQYERPYLVLGDEEEKYTLHTSTQHNQIIPDSTFKTMIASEGEYCFSLDTDSEIFGKFNTFAATEGHDGLSIQNVGGMIYFESFSRHGIKGGKQRVLIDQIEKYDDKRTVSIVRYSKTKMGTWHFQNIMSGKYEVKILPELNVLFLSSTTAVGLHYVFSLVEATA
jgi:hypothetical protein